MKILRDALLCLLLGILCVLGMKSLALLGRVEASAAALDATVPQIAATIAELRGAAREQRSYYKATGKALAISAIAFGRLVQATDRELQPVLREAAAAMAETRGLAVVAREQVAANGKASEAALEALRESVQGIQGSLAATERILGNLEVASTRADAVAAKTQETADNVAAATASIREMLNPKKVPFWRRLLELMIPRPTVAVRR